MDETQRAKFLNFETQRPPALTKLGESFHRAFHRHEDASTHLRLLYVNHKEGVIRVSVNGSQEHRFIIPSSMVQRCISDIRYRPARALKTLKALDLNKSAIKVTYK